MKISKSKQELARIISENGGWRGVAKFAAQDSNKSFYGARVCFYHNKPYVNGSEWIDGSNGLACNAGECIEGLMAISNWHQTTISRAEYFHLYQAPDADGWIEFNGYERPSGYFNVVIDVKLENGNEITDSSGRFEWDTNGPSRIIAYRLHKPEQAEPEFCESVMRSIPEPTAKPSIEQLATDYRNAKDYAERKQQEADDAKADAEAKLAELVDAGEALGLVIDVRY